MHRLLVEQSEAGCANLQSQLVPFAAHDCYVGNYCMSEKCFILKSLYSVKAF